MRSLAPERQPVHPTVIVCILWSFYQSTSDVSSDFPIVLYVIRIGVLSQEQETPLRIGANRTNAGGSVRVANSDVPTSPVIPSTSPASHAHLHDIDLSSPLNYGTPSSMGSVRTPRSGIRGKLYTTIFCLTKQAKQYAYVKWPMHFQMIPLIHRNANPVASRYPYWATNPSSESKLRYGKLSVTVSPNIVRHLHSRFVSLRIVVE